MSEFKISRLRFNWVGPWQDQYEYNKDEIVQHEGKAYVCLIPHTSNGFQSDLADVQPKWELMMTGQTWKGVWAPSTSYALDNIVIFGGIVYKCNTPHLSSSIIDPDIAYWDTYAESKTWKSEWTSATTYGPGDIVNYGGTAYECTIAHVSAATDLEGLEADYTDIDDSTERYWKISSYGVQYRGEYNSFSADSTILRYKLNDVVKYGPSLYRCIWGHSPADFVEDYSTNIELADSFVEDYWEEWLPGLDFENLWDANEFYQPGDVVLYGGYLYQSKIINNIGNKPPVNSSADDYSTDAWELISEAFEIRGSWSSEAEYKVGSVVRYGGDLYVAIRDNSNENPGNFEVTVPYESEGSTGKTLKLQAADSVDPKTIAVGMTVTGEGFASGQQVEAVSAENDLEDLGEITYRVSVSGPQGSDAGNKYILDDDYRLDVTLNAGYTLVFDQSDSSNVYYGGENGNINPHPISFSTDINGELTLDPEGEDGELLFPLGSAYTQGVRYYLDGVLVTREKYIEDFVSATDRKVKLDVTLDTPETLYYYCAYHRDMGASITSVYPASNIITVTLNYAPDGTISDSALLTFAGVRSSHWELMIPGFQWEGKWQDSYLYHIDDVVYYGNATYRATREHTSALVSRPDNDLQNNYWTIYLQHDQRNKLTDLGQMILYRDDDLTTLDIGEENSILKIINGLPVWSDLDFTPNVYYVATNGIDEAGRGTTPDTAWKTIKYACDTVKLGTLQQNARTLLENNKEWIVQETFYWFLYQQNNNIGNFGTSYNFDNEKVIRDARLIVDGVIKDITRGGNAQTVQNTLAYFDLESTNKFTNQTIADQAIYFIDFFAELFDNIQRALTNTIPAQSYQQLELDRLGEDWDPGDAPNPPISQYVNTNLTLESDTISIVQAYERIILDAFIAGSPDSVPAANQSAYSTIFIKAGTYHENLPIVVPCNTALNGDELRGTTVQPANPVNTLCTRTQGDVNLFTVGSTVNMEHNTPVQFVSLNPVDEISTIIGDVVAGQTYYVIGSSITPTTFSVSETPDGPSFDLFTNQGNMYVYGGEALENMFLVQNATGIRNMTVKGLRGTLTAENEYLTRRPTGGAYVSLDPGTGPDDTSAWITYKSPYVQNVTTFGKGCVGLKIDSTLHNGGNRSVVSNDFTQVISDGIGIWCTGGDALTEAVSVFSYYNYAGYFAEDGAKIRATNGNSSYGTYGVVSEGFDSSETPATGIVNNTSGEATAQAVSALGANAEILKLQFTHAGEQYYEETTNLLLHSNSLLTNNAPDDNWETDSNVSIVRAPTTPYENEFAWRITANTSLTDSAYFEQTVPVSPQGRVYVGVAGVNIDGSGVDATFNVTVGSDGYEVAVNNGGSGYVVGNQITLSGKLFGGRSPENDIIVTVDELSITAILTVQHTGTVPTGSALPYNVSIHVKKGDAAYVDLYTTFSGFSNVTNYVRYNFETNATSTEFFGGNAVLPQNIRADFIDDGWYRISYSVYDETARNTSLRYRVYPRGVDGIAGYTDFYGAQITIGSDVQTFIENTDTTISTYANLSITGAGSGVKAVADELRTGSVFQSRLLESADVRLGGLGYKIQTNNAQSGNDEYLTLAQSEVAEPSEYEGMRIVLSSGKGAGQYGIISNYDVASKQASVVKESFISQEIVASTAADDRLTFVSDSDFYNIYEGQKVTFTPTTYEIDVESVAQSSVAVQGTLGDLNNYMYVSSTARLRVGQKINFSGETFGGVITNFDYYIIDILDERSIQISTGLGGAVWPLTNVNIEDPDGSPIVLTGEVADFTLNYPDDTSYLKADTTANMQVTQPIQFTGKAIGDIVLGDIYYIHDVYNATQFSISASKLSLNVSNTSATGNVLTVADTSGLDPLTPIIFQGAVLGGLAEKTKYYINSIVSGTTFTLSSDVITGTATATEAITNLITVDSTTGYTVNSPIKFTGVTFGGIQNDKVYYIQVVNDATTITISETPGGAAVPLTTATGSIIVNTTLDTVTLTTATGSFNAITTGDKEVLTAGRAAMEGNFFTVLYGNVVEGTIYYVKEKFEGSDNQITISETDGGAVFALQDDDGSMQLNEVGWDHINAGTPPVTNFDSTSIYSIEPRITFDRPGFTAELVPLVEGYPESGFSSILSDGHKVFAIPSLGDRIKGTSDFYNWDLDYTLPIQAAEGTNGGWTDSVYGNNVYFILSKTGQDSLYSNSEGLTWLSVNLPTLPAGGPGEDDPYWSSVAFGDGRFVAVSRGAENSAYSTNGGSTWTEVTGPIGDEDWVDIAYGKGTFVAISGSSHTVKYSTDGGETWQSSTVDTSGDSTINNWRRIEFGNGRFVAVAYDDEINARSSVYSFDGITWYESNTNVNADLLTYGQGIFVAIDNTSGYSYISADGYFWLRQDETVGGDFACIGFGIEDTTRKGWFMTLSTSGEESYRLSAGCRAIARATVVSSSLSGISMLEPGSGYLEDSFVPNVKITDPNNSEEALIQVRVGDGVLGAPTFVSQGTGYNTTSTAIAIRGSGFSDAFQTGIRIICKDITRFPAPGDNLQFEGNPEVYRVAKATALRGTEAPNLEAEIQLSPQITQETSPANDTPLTIRSRFSQCRITNHDFLNIGFGNEIQSNYPGLPENTGLEPQDEVVETNNGRVFYSSTDQDGNFRVGDLFAVEQATGVVTLSAEEFGLEGLTELTIGGVALGGSPVTISEFSTDGTFVANSNNIVPTQKAIRTYLASRLSQGGSDTFTGLLTAGTVKVGGPDEIDSTVAQGLDGHQIFIPTKAMLEGPTAAWGGDGIAMAYFMKTFNR